MPHHGDQLDAKGTVDGVGGFKEAFLLASASRKGNAQVGKLPMEPWRNAAQKLGAKTAIGVQTAGKKQAKGGGVGVFLSRRG